MVRARVDCPDGGVEVSMSESKSTEPPWVVRVQRGCYEAAHTFNGPRARDMALQKYRVECAAVDGLSGPWCVTIEARGGLEGSFSTISEIPTRMGRHPSYPPDPWWESAALPSRRSD